MLVSSRLVTTDLGVDQLGEDEGRLEEVEHQGSQIEGRVEFAVDADSPSNRGI